MVVRESATRFEERNPGYFEDRVVQASKEIFHIESDDVTVATALDLFERCNGKVHVISWRRVAAIREHAATKCVGVAPFQ